MKLLRAARTRRRAWVSPCLEVLEDRLTPVANLLVSVDGSYPQQLLKEFTQQGTLVQSQVIPPGAAQQDARGLVVAPDGRVHVFNGSDPSYLSTYDPAAGTWSQRAYGGWSDSSYGRLGVYQNFVFASDGFTSSNGSTEWGIVRFNLSDGTATRFAADFGPQDLTVGRDGLVYALAPFQVVRVYNPQTLALVRTVTLPSSVGGSSQFYTGIAVNANGDIYASTSSNRTVHRFDSAGTLLGSVTVSLSVGWLYDIDLSPDGTQVAVGSSSGNVALMSSTLTGVTSFAVGGGTAYVSFGLDPAAPPWLRVNDVAVTEGNIGTATATFTVSLSAASSQTVTVNWATANGTATAGSDYTAGSGTLTFAPGETTKTVDVAVLGDTLSEGNETFTVNLSGASGAPVGDGQGVGTILDDEGTPSLVVNDVYVNEGNSGTTSAVFTVSLSAASTQTVTVNWATAASSATAGVDYTTASGTLTFAAGQMSQTLSVTVSGDTLDEYDETFFVNLSGAGNATIADSQGVGTISDDDDAAAAINDVSVSEGDTGTVNAVFTVTLAGAHDHTVSVSWSTADNTALSSSDYTAASGSLSFAPGETSKTLTVAVRGDTVSEPTETFFVNLTTAGSGLADWQGVGTILDNEPPALSVNDVSVTEGNSGTANATFTVSMSKPWASSVTVDWATANGTAVAGNDYAAAGGSLTFAPGETSKTVVVAVLGDTTDEPNETFFLNLMNPSGATIADSQGVGTITDDDPAALLRITDVSLFEASGPAVFTVSLSAASGWTVTVNYATQAFTATAGSDYTTVSGTLTFAPGETSKTVAVPIVDDAVQESDESFFVNLSGAVNAGYADSSGQGTIRNDDWPSLSINDVTVTEGDYGTTTATFTVTLSYASTDWIRVDWATANGTATADLFPPYLLDDYAAASGWFFFTSGQTSSTLSVTVRGDVKFEPNETFFVNLSLPSGGATIADGQGTGTIADDDPYVLNWSDVSVSEATGAAVFTITLSQPSPQTVTVNYATSAFTAAAAVDYTDVSGTLTFAPGETAKTVAVPVINDTMYEGEELFYFDLSGAVNAKVATGRRNGRIQNDDPYPLLSINDVTVVEGDTGVVYATFTVSLSNPTYQTVDLFWLTDNGTASWAFDYAYSSGSLHFNPGETSKTVSIAVYGDLMVEPDETFSVILNNGGSNAGLADGLGVCTIMNNDTPAISVSDAAVTEGNSGTVNATFTVSLSKAIANTVMVDWATADGTAADGSDYTAASGTLTFDPGQTSKTFTVAVAGDMTDEPNETFTVNLANPYNATIADAQGVGTITDDDAAPTLSINDVTLAESAGQAAFTVSLSAASGWTVTVNYATQNNTAIAGSDYTATTGTLTFAPGETSKTVPVPVIDDANSESDEVFFVFLSGASNAGYADSQGQATILDDDSPLVSVSDVTVTEGNSGTVDATFAVTLSKPWTSSVTVDWNTTDGTAVAGSDYTAASGSLTFAPGETSKTFTVGVRGDTTDEPDETFTVNLSNPANATIGDGVGFGTITDDDAAPTLAINDVSVLESAGQAAFTVSLSAASGWTVTVNYATQDSTAVAGSDYTATAGTLTFAPGETTKTVSVPVIDDAAVENDEAFFVNLSGASNAGIADSQGQATIVDDDPPLMSISDATVTEGNSGTTDATFTVTLSKPWTAPVTVGWATADGTAVAGSDYTAETGSLTFAPGETTKAITVAVRGDTTDEPDEMFLVNLSNPSNATITDGQGAGTITDDDAPPTLSIIDVTVSESAGSAAFTVSLSAASGWTVAVNYTTQDFTAVAGSDYTATSGTLTFAPGETSKTVSVPVTDDANQENDESFFLNLSGATNAGIADSQGKATILDDDPPLVSVNDVSVTEGDSGSVTATFTVTLSKPGNTSVWVDWASANGTATAGVDYTAAHGTLVFSPGQTSKTLSVTVLGDLRTEADETFLVNLSNVSGGAVADGQGVGTILDDDPYVLTVNDASAVEATGVLVFTVTLSQANTQAVTVNYATQDYMAVAGSDYVATSGTLVFAPGETVKTISVQVIDDNRRESYEVFYLHLSDPVNAKLGNSIGNGSILDDDPVPSVTIHDVSVVEGDSGTTAAVFSVTLSNPTDWTVDLFWVTANDTASYLWDYAYSGGSLTFAPGETAKTITVSVYGDLTDEPDETFFVNLSSASNATVADGQGVCTILTDDFPPVANAGPDQTAGEGAAVAFNGSGSTDPDGDVLTYHWDFGDGATADVMAPTHAYADNGAFTVTLTVSDGHGGSSTDTLNVTVTNVAPTAAATGPSGGVRGQSRAFTFSATDPGAADAAAPFTYAINWGDGNTQTVSGPAGGVPVEHVFTTSSSYTVSATATDKDGGTSNAATQAITIVAVQLQNGNLVVGGTTGVDKITLSRASSTSVKVVVNGQNLGSFTTSGTVLAYGQAGNDIIEVTGSNFPRPVQFFGDAGNDSLDGRQAVQGAVLVGGVGDDSLLGGAARDILIGGLGVDTLRGGNGDDILIGGTTDHDANAAALTSLAAEWRRTDADLATRIGHLNGSQGGGLNGAYQLNATTVHDDGAIDELFGEGGSDWFIYRNSGAFADHLNDWQSGDAALLI
jgi:hypothetical protein